MKAFGKAGVGNLIWATGGLMGALDLAKEWWAKEWWAKEWWAKEWAELDFQIF